MMKSYTLPTAILLISLFADAAVSQQTDAGAAPRTGELQLTFTLTEVAGAEAASAAESIVAPDEPIEWKLYVPDNYDPERPAGLIVFISPSNSGDIQRQWKSVLDSRNMIWICAEQSGNRVKVSRRALFAFIAPTIAGSQYRIDSHRIYLSGFSGGSRVAGMVAADYPGLFKGAIYMGGVNSLDDHPPRQIELFSQNRYVFITGEYDHARDQTRRVQRQYVESGIENSDLMDIQDMGHEKPDDRYFKRAIDYLDERSAM